MTLLVVTAVEGHLPGPGTQVGMVSFGKIEISDKTKVERFGQLRLSKDAAAQIEGLRSSCEPAK